MLEVESLTAEAGTFQLQEVSLRVASGECHALLGPSGSGKSTLLHVILGLRPFRRGRILLDGTDLAGRPTEARGIGYVPQQVALFPHMTVLENLTYSPMVRRRPLAEVRPLLDQLIATTGIGGLLNRYPATLSGGERQRVALVRALVGRPRLVLLDEPFTALNESLRRGLWWLMRELQNQQQLTILLVTHDLAEAYYLADRVTVLLNGRVAQQGDKTEVYGRPAVAEVARFLGVETLQPGRILEVDDGLAVVETGRARLTATVPPGLSGEVLVSIRGEEVQLEKGTGSPAVVSARNRLAARVVSVRPGSPLLCVELDAGFKLYSLVTGRAGEELELRPGSTVTAVIKASAIHLIPRP